MTRYVALLRGINVGRHNRIPMATLRELLEGLGCTAVQTHLQSGNAVFAPPQRGPGTPAAVAGELERVIAERLSLQVPVLVREGADLRRVAAHGPLADPDFDPSRLLVTFLSGPVDRERLAGLDPTAYAPDRFWPGQQEIYVYCPDGVRGSKLRQEFWEKRLGLIGTARNWNTVRKLAALVATADTP
ncbi:DUF1697 domain-containing protein [Streptomyces sp. HSW2009]|uniref:DUF1697 domain-containing protein n=1 Tax=Streptomyces sp. HSW2009 TaxID=3142890 RepID=UPI0032EB02CB